MHTAVETSPVSAAVRLQARRGLPAPDKNLALAEERRVLNLMLHPAFLEKT